MLVENQKVEIKWARQNKKYYENLGYAFTWYGDTFYVSPQDLPKGTHVKVKVKCDYCGDILDIQWRDYLKCKTTKYACKHCRQIKTSENNLIQRQNYLYNAALEFCNTKGYILLSDKNSIKNSNSYVEYKCPKHGIHSTKIYSLISGHGCYECGREESGNKSKLSYDYIESKFNEFGGILLNKEEYIGWDVKNLRVICPECNKVFTTSYNSFIKHEGQFCPECSASESKGEKKIRLFLENNKISFIPEYRFDDCRDQNTLPFDFYLPLDNICIEYQGIQHYEVVEVFGGKKGFELRKKHDKIKYEYCKHNNLNLIRIPYWNYNQIEEILNNELILHEDIV